MVTTNDNLDALRFYQRAASGSRPPSRGVDASRERSSRDPRRATTGSRCATSSSSRSALTARAPCARGYSPARAAPAPRTRRSGGARAGAAGRRDHGGRGLARAGTAAVARSLTAAAAGLTQAPGTLGFRTAAGGFHATRVLDSRRRRDAWTATLATNDPAGRRLAVRLAPDAHGVMALSVEVTGSGAAAVEATGISFRARPGERYLGFGERSNRVDQRGGEVESYVAEGPYEEDDRAIIPAFVPAWGFHPRPDATYYPVPWLLSTAGYGVLVDDPETSYFRLDQGGSGVWSVEVEAAASQPARVRRPAPGRRAAPLHRADRPPAGGGRAVLLRPLVPAHAARTGAAVLAAAAGGDAPLSVAQTYTHYLPCAAQTGREEAERARVAGFHRAGLAVTTYFNPMICTTHPRFGEAAAGGALVENPAGEPYVYRYSTLTSFDVSQFDFTAPAPAATSTGSSCARRWPTATTAGWRTSASTPRSTRGPPTARPASALHNAYPRQYHCGAFDGVAGAPRALARFVRSGWTGQRPLLADRLGRRPDRGLGLRRAALGGDQRAHDGAVRA